jgi:acetyl esterase
MPDVNEEWITVEGGPTGSVRARIVRPLGAAGTPARRALHPRRRLGRQRPHPRPPRARTRGWRQRSRRLPPRRPVPRGPLPIAIEPNYAVARWMVSDGATKDLDAAWLAVAGDSVGGNMTAALTLVARSADIRVRHNAAQKAGLDPSRVRHHGASPRTSRKPHFVRTPNLDSRHSA